jgi:hypothetical protein
MGDHRQLSALRLAALTLAALVAGGAAPAGWQSTHDARGFTVSYPADWKANPDYFDSDYPTSDGPPPQLHALALSPVGDLQPGTTLASSDVRVMVAVLPPFRERCEALSFIAAPPPDFNSGIDSDTPDYAHVTGGDPGGWYTYEDFVWRISVKPCVAVHYTIGYHAADSDQAKSEKPFDRVALLKLLDAIRASVTLDR